MGEDTAERWSMALCRMAGAVLILLILYGVLTARQCCVTLFKHISSLGIEVLEADSGSQMTTTWGSPRQAQKVCKLLGSINSGGQLPRWPPMGLNSQGPPS